jgi:glycosyltransferase involved in cell wall biosynthesis
LKVAYVTTYNASDLSQWSGTGHHIARSLESEGIEVVHVGPLEDRGGPMLSARRAMERARGKRMLRERDPAVIRGYAKQIAERLESLDADWIFSSGTIPISALGGTTPVAFWTDATFAQMVGLYPEFQNLAGGTIAAGNEAERRAIERASLAIYASEWAAKSAISDYGADRDKVKVLPFGANITSHRTSEEIDRIVSQRGTDVCRILFAGKDWKRKGGNLALEIVARLHDRGVRAELTIVGANPEIPSSLGDIVTVVGFIPKDSPTGNAALESLFAASHFLVLPSRAERFGVVFAEASSFGLPSIATDVGGIPGAVRNGLNGYTYPLASVVADSTECIARLWSDRSAYEKLCRSAYDESRNRLSWDVSGAALSELLSEMHPSRTLRAPVSVALSKSTGKDYLSAAKEGGRRTIGLTTAGTPDRPLVSVITVARNAGATIERTIQSVLGQTYEHLEYIVVDGASTDETLDVIRRHDLRLDYWMTEPDKGIYDAMNKGIGLVSEPDAYVIFVNADDRLFSPDAIERAIAIGNGADVIYGKMRLTDGDASGVMGREVTASDLARETLCHPATFMRRTVFDKVGRFDMSYRIAADYDLIVRTFQHPVTTRFVDVVVSEMSMGGMSEDQFMLSCRERKRVVRKRFPFPASMAGVWQVNLYDIPRNLARRWLARAGLLRYWRALRRA